MIRTMKAGVLPTEVVGDNIDDIGLGARSMGCGNSDEHKGQELSSKIHESTEFYFFQH